MEKKYIVNYKLIFINMIVLLIVSIFIVILTWKESLQAGIFTMILFIGAHIYGVKYFFAQERIKSVIIVSNTLKIEYRKTDITVPFENCAKIEHYKRGPLTERIRVYAKGYIYEIPWDIKGFHEMCGSIYKELLNMDMEYIADEWFKDNFGKCESLKKKN